MLMGLSAYAQIPNFVRLGAQGEPEPPATQGRGTVLFSTFAGIEPTIPFAISSQNFTDFGFLSQGADDFTITGNGAVIQDVEVRGIYFAAVDGGPTGPAASLNVYILGNSGGLPDTTNLSGGAIYAAENISYTDVTGFGDFRVTLPGGGVTLLAGTYWLVVQTNQNVVTEGQWGWTESASSANSGVAVGFESAWFQTVGNIPSSDGSTFTCIGSWGSRLGTCDFTIPDPDPIPPAEPDLAFQLEGIMLTPGITVTPTSLTTTEAGGTDSFTVVLDAPPLLGTDVDIAIDDSAGAGEFTALPATLTFNGGNWDVPQTVTVAGVDDAVADGDTVNSIVNTVSASGDPSYAVLDPADVSVTNQDDESPGIGVSPVSGVNVTEGGTNTFGIRPFTAPTADVTISLSDVSGVTSVPASVTLPSGSTATQMVTITGGADDIDIGDLAFTVVTGASVSADGAYNGLTVTDVTGTRFDDDTAGFTVLGIDTTTDENGGTGSLSVVLNSEPTADVTIGVFSSAPGEATVLPTSLTFTPAGWDTPQIVIVTGVDDDIDDGTASYSVGLQPATSSDPAYDSLDPADVPFTNADNGDSTGVTVNPTSGLVTTEAGGTDTFTVVLDTEPIVDVSISMNTDDPTEGIISDDGINFGNSVTLTFTAANWSMPQTVTVQGVDDNVRGDGDILYNIVTDAPVTLDPTYSLLTAGQISDVSVTNTNDDVPGVTVTPLTITTFEDQTQPAATFTIVLDTEPTADVVITATTSNTAEGLVSSDGINFGTTATFTFTSVNWATPQTVTVQGQQDFTVDMDVAYTIMNVVTAGDGNYIGIDPDDVAATNINEDLCDPTISFSCPNGFNGTLALSGGVPGCVVDIYDTNGSTNTIDFTLLQANVTIGAGGTATTGITCTRDTNYVAVVAGSFQVVSIPFITVPTLGQWGLLGFVFLLGLAGIATIRRRRTI
jgi:hypothetical protein